MPFGAVRRRHAGWHDRSGAGGGTRTQRSPASVDARDDRVTRRRRAGRRAHDRARRGAHAGVHAGRDEGDREERSTRTRCARSARRSCSATRTTCTSGPGDELIAELGGLHRFMGWDGPILTDSGGFQVFSLRDTLLAVDDDGVTFRSVYDGAATRFTPELAAAIQRNLGSDVAMCLDQVPPAGVPRGELEEAVRRTTEWARRQRHAPRADGPAPLRDQPGRHRPRAPPPLASRSCSSSTSTATRSAGSRSARSAAPMFETTDWVTALLPAGQAALLHGHRRPRGDPRGDRGRRRHVRLRPADPHRPHRQRDHLAGPAQPPERPLRPRHRAARRDLRLPGVHARSRGPTSATS